MEFSEALDDAIDKFLAEGGTRSAVISALELKLMALKEEDHEDEEGSD